MTTESTPTTELTRDQLITIAMQKAGLLHSQHIPDASMLNLGSNLLYAGLQSLQNDGIILRASDRYTQALAAGQAFIVPPAETVSIEENATVKSSDGFYDLPMTIYSQEQYQAIANKAIAGRPLFYYPERQANGTWKIFLYPVPTADWPSITYPRSRRLRDVTTGNLTIDLDTKWTDAVLLYLGFNLARHMGRTELATELRQEYSEAKERAFSDETIRGDMTMLVYRTPWDS